MSKKSTPIAEYEEPRYLELKKDLTKLNKKTQNFEKHRQDKLESIETYYQTKFKPKIEHLDKLIDAKKESILGLEKELQTTDKKNKVFVEGLIVIENDSINSYEMQKKTLTKKYENLKKKLEEQLETRNNKLKKDKIEKLNELAQLKELSVTPLLYSNVKKHSEKMPIQTVHARFTRRNSSETPLIGGTSKRDKKMRARTKCARNRR